jgi:hypothetical protein
MKKILLITLLFPLICFGQKQGNIWYFGNYAGVTFNSGTPVALTNGAMSDTLGHYSEGTSAISDSSGNILMYSNGQTLWNSNNQIMPNGDSLLGNYSSTQSSVIVPLPGSSRYFYVFTVDDIWVDHERYGFRYSVVDMCLDGGLGDVIPGKKNILLIDTTDEKVAAVRSSNGRDYWIIAHKLFTDAFYSYLLTPSGISDTVITHIGFVDSSAQGQLKISPDGKKLAISSSQAWVQPNHFALYNFDNSTGIVSDFIALVVPTKAETYGVEFSPDNSKLYATYGSVPPINMGILEYDISSGNQATINASMTIVYKDTNELTLRGLQLGPNGKIYMVSLSSGYLLAIDTPNNYGATCRVHDTAVYLAGMQGSEGVPTFIAGYSYSNTVNNCSDEGINGISENEKLLIYPNPANKSFFVQIPNTSNARKLTFYNVTGQLLLERQIKGVQNIEISSGEFPAGVYFLKIQMADGSNLMKKVEIVR